MSLNTDIRIEAVNQEEAWWDFVLMQVVWGVCVVEYLSENDKIGRLVRRNRTYAVDSTQA